MLSSVDVLFLRVEFLFDGSSPSSSSDDDDANSPEIFLEVLPSRLRLISIGLGRSARRVRRTGLGGIFGESSFASLDPMDRLCATDACANEAAAGRTEDAGSGFG